MPQIQILFANGGEQAASVRDWLDARFPHIHATCSAQPGLSVTVQIPRNDEKDGGEHWWNRPEAQLVEFTGTLSPIDVAVEILATCFHDLQMDTMQIVAIHLTADRSGAQSGSEEPGPRSEHLRTADDVPPASEGGLVL